MNVDRIHEPSNIAASPEQTKLVRGQPRLLDRIRDERIALYQPLSNQQAGWPVAHAPQSRECMQEVGMVLLRVEPGDTSEDGLVWIQLQFIPERKAHIFGWGHGGHIVAIGDNHHARGIVAQLRMNFARALTTTDDPGGYAG